MCVLLLYIFVLLFVFFFKQKTAYEMRISDWSSDVCSSDLQPLVDDHHQPVDLAAVAVDGIFVPVLGIVREMRFLSEHRADARYLEHQPLPADRALHRIGGQETPGLFGEVEQDRARLDRKSTRLNSSH